MKTKKTTIVGALLFAVLYSMGCAADKGWTKLHSLYDCRNKNLIYKVEGTARCEKTKTDFWGFGQTKTSKEHLGDTEGYFVKVRVDQNISLDGLSPSVEYIGGTFFQDYAKAGFVFKKKIGKEGPFVMLKAFPVRINGKDDTTLGVLVDQKIIPGKLKATTWLDQDIHAGTYIGEATVDWNFYKGLEATIGATVSGSIHEAFKPTPYLGLKFEF